MSNDKKSIHGQTVGRSSFIVYLINSLVVGVQRRCLPSGAFQPARRLL